MGDEPIDEISAVVAGGWSWMYAAFLMLHKLIAPYPQHYIGRDLGNSGYRITVYRSPGSAIGIIDITGSSSETVISARPATHADAEYWREIVKRLRGFASIRREVEPTPDEMIEYFYRRKAQDPRTTLRKVADENLWSYEALKKHKQRYDKARKWGARGLNVPQKAGK